MHFQYIPYIWPLMTSAFVSLSLGIYSLFKQRKTKGAKSFILCMFVVTIWSAANALEMAATDLPTKTFWANMQYIAYCYSPVTLLAMCMQFTGYDYWVKSKKIVWLAILPTIIVILMWTNHWHGLMRYDIFLDYNGSFPVIAKKYGPAFFVHITYAHLLNLTAIFLLIRAVFFKNTVYSKQAVALLIGVSLIVIPNIMYVLGFSPVERFDITPVFFGPAGIIIAWGIFRYKLFDLVPMARATVIENMEAGVMVLDLQDRIIDINPAFQRILGPRAFQVSFKTIQEVGKAIPELVRACTDRNIAQREFSVQNDGKQKVYEVLLSPLTDSKGVLLGRLVVTHDITEKKQVEQEVLKHQWKLAVSEERERLARDMHDNLGQVLGFINFQAQGIGQELENSGVTIGSKKLEKLVKVTQTAHQEIREYIHNFRNPSYEEKDFMVTLVKGISSMEEQTGLQVELITPEGFTGEEMEPYVRLNLLNIIKEALNNIRKHAYAQNARIIFALQSGQLYAEVEDDGRGFDPHAHEQGDKSKYGLDIMRERALLIEAKIEIESTLGQGSRIKLCVPIKEVEKRSVDEINAG